MGQKRAELIGHRGHAIRTRLIVHVRELIAPEELDLCVGDGLDHLPPETFVHKELHDIAQIGFGLLQERQQGMPKKMLHPRTPGFRPLLLQCLDQARGDQRANCIWNAGEGIVSQGATGIGDVPVVVRAINHLMQVLGQITMWVDQTEAGAVVGVLLGEVEQKRRLTAKGTGLS